MKLKCLFFFFYILFSAAARRRLGLKQRRDKSHSLTAVEILRRGTIETRAKKLYTHINKTKKSLPLGLRMCDLLHCHKTVIEEILEIGEVEGLVSLVHDRSAGS